MTAGMIPNVAVLRSLEFHLLLTNLTFSTKVATIAHLQGPTAFVGHERAKLHGQLAHVVFALRATRLAVDH